VPLIDGARKCSSISWLGVSLTGRIGADHRPVSESCVSKPDTPADGRSVDRFVALCLTLPPVGGTKYVRPPRMRLP